MHHKRTGELCLRYKIHKDIYIQAISLLEYLLKNGVATCVDETRDQIYYLRNLENFSVMDQGKERGQGGTPFFSSIYI